MSGTGLLPAVRRTDIEICADHASDRVIVVDPLSGRQFRLTSSAVQVLSLLDGTKSPVEIATRMGAPEADSEVGAAVERLVSLGLATRPSRQGRHMRPRVRKDPLLLRLQRRVAYWQSPQRKIRYVPPGAIEINLGGLNTLMNRLQWLADRVGRQSVQLALNVFSVSGLFAWGLTWRDTFEALGRPTTLWISLLVFLLTLVVTSIHELAHGLALRRYGGRVRRMGLLLLYGSPSFYCDVSDSWRLPREQRLRVALAGVRVHFLVAAVLAWSMAVAVPSATKLDQFAGLLMLANYVMGISNLIPFVKFDGYVALIGWMDIPHARKKSIDQVKESVGRLVFGRGNAPAQVDLQVGGVAWFIFGVLSMLLAPLLVIFALASYGPTLYALLGVVGAGIILLATLMLFMLPCQAVATSFGKAKTRGVGPLRRFTGLAMLAIFVTIALQVPVFPDRDGATFQTIHGKPFLIVTGQDTVLDGTDVTLSRPGVVFHPVVAHAKVCGPQKLQLVDPSAGGPIILPGDASSRRRIGHTYLLCLHETPGAAGGAVMERGVTTAADWLQHHFLTPYLAAF